MPSLQQTQVPQREQPTARRATCQHAQPDLPGKDLPFSHLAQLEQELSCYRAALQPSRAAIRQRGSTVPSRLQAPIQSSNSLTLDLHALKTHSRNNLQRSNTVNAAEINLSVTREVQREEENTPESPALRLGLHRSQISVSAVFSDIFNELAGSGGMAMLQKTSED